MNEEILPGIILRVTLNRQLFLSGELTPSNPSVGLRNCDPVPNPETAV
jgi:hypothetical protein